MGIDNMAMSFRSITLALLAVFLAFGNGAAQTTQTGVKVEIVSQEPLRLHVTLSVGGYKRVTIYRDQLPWATRYTMVWTVVTADGECLERLFPVEMVRSVGFPLIPDRLSARRQPGRNLQGAR